MPEDQSPTLLSRRGLLKAGLAGASAVPICSSTAASAAELPLVRPVSSQKAYEAFGVCAHPHFASTGYRYTGEWMAALDLVDAPYFRGMYVDGRSSTVEAARHARAKGIRWGMLVSPDLFMAGDALRTRIRHLAANAADLCLYIEGVNEPNYVRGGGSPPSDWVQRTVRLQRIIWETVKGDSRLRHVKVVGPSLHSVAATAGQYAALRDAGLPLYMDYAGVHSYPGGYFPERGLGRRVGWATTYWKRPVWVTETGYTNALHRPSGHNPVPDDVSAAYAPSALLAAVDRSCKVVWYELLDDPDTLAREEIESNFGMYRTAYDDQPPWPPKPVVATLTSFLAQLKDPGPAYTPAAIPFRATSAATDVRVTLTAKRNGVATAHVRRATDCWDPVRQQRTPVVPVPVTLQWATGSLTVPVTHAVQSVPLV